MVAMMGFLLFRGSWVYSGSREYDKIIVASRSFEAGKLTPVVPGSATIDVGGS